MENFKTKKQIVKDISKQKQKQKTKTTKQNKKDVRVKKKTKICWEKFWSEISLKGP